jgi:thiamine kinase-like enzyme
MMGFRYPNPFAFAASTKGISGNIKLSPILGFMHGDLHGSNVLVSEFPPTASEFYVIDFDSFEERKPLLFDHAYFELSYLLTHRENAVLDRWISLLESLEGVQETGDVVSSLKDAEDQGHVWCAALMRSTITNRFIS